MTATEYSTTIKLVEFMGIKETIPDPKIIGSDRGIELVGTGDGSTARFYLDHAFIIASSYTIYYGATEAAAVSTPLTETTHYVMSKDEGYITLTTAGKTLVSTNKIYAAYSFSTLQLTDTQMQDALNRAGNEIEKSTNNKWTDGTAETPNYAQYLDEKHDGRGGFKQSYFTEYRSLPNISTTLTEAASATDVEITVASSAGFPSTGYLLIDNEKVTYSAKTDTTFTVTALSADHDDNSVVKPYVFEVSVTEAGTEPTWSVLSEDDEFDVDLDTGRFTILWNNVASANTVNNLYPPKNTPNRVRISYLHGNSTIPENITTLCLMIAAKNIMHMGVRKKTSDGYGEFKPELVNIDESWIDKIIRKYKNLNISNV